MYYIMHNFKKFFWPVVSIILLVFIYFNLGSINLLNINPLFFVCSALFFFLSTIFWALQWSELFEIPAKEAVVKNTKALMGIFSPANLGGDALRVHFSKNKTKALASSFVIKFFKFILMAILLIIALAFISFEFEFPFYALTFIFMIIFTFVGAFIVLSFTSSRVTNFVNKIFKKHFVSQFRKDLLDYFTKPDISHMFRGIIWILISTFFEIIAVLFAFYAIGVNISFLHAFIISSVINTLALMTITPQGIGFVEAGGYFVLSFAIFGLVDVQIGGFLIIWNVIRIWIPSLIGLFSFWCNK